MVGTGIDETSVRDLVVAMQKMSVELLRNVPVTAAEDPTGIIRLAMQGAGAQLRDTAAALYAAVRLRETEPARNLAAAETARQRTAAGSAGGGVAQ
jgi:hypothetical protein